MTLQWSLVGEGLTGSDYKNSNGESANSKGFMAAGSNGRWSAHHNLLVHSTARNPLSKGGPQALALLDYRYNAIYNWSACHGNFHLGEYNEYGTPGNDASLQVNLVGNKVIPGPNSSLQCVNGIIGGKQTRVFAQGNSTPWCKSGCSTLADMGFTHQDSTFSTPASDSQFRASSAFAAPAITATSLADLEAVLAANVGATKPARDALDARLVTEFQSRTGNIGRNGAPFPVLSNGTPPVDSDHDGMPDDWEKARGLNPSSAADGAAVAANGYTNLENYLNALAGDPVPGASADVAPSPPTQLKVD
jgi:hypothetical protein